MINELIFFLSHVVSVVAVENMSSYVESIHIKQRFGAPYVLESGRPTNTTCA